MNDEELLQKVKIAIGETSDYQDELLKIYIDEVKQYMLDSGVSEEKVSSSKALGTIARGVMDLWDYGNGETNLSPYFKERVIQLRGGELDV